MLKDIVMNPAAHRGFMGMEFSTFAPLPVHGDEERVRIEKVRRAHLFLYVLVD